MTKSIKKFSRARRTRKRKERQAKRPKPHPLILWLGKHPGISRSDLARDVDTTRQQIYNIIHGLSRPSVGLVVKLAKRTGLAVEAFV